MNLGEVEGSRAGKKALGASEGGAEGLDCLEDNREPPKIL